MIFLEIPFFRHYVFAVVQKSSSPTHPGGNPPLIRYARAKQPVGRVEQVGRVGQHPLHPLLFSRKRRKAPSQPGRLRYFLNRKQAHPSKQQPYKFSEFSVDKKNGLRAISPRQVFSYFFVVKNCDCFSWISGLHYLFIVFCVMNFLFCCKDMCTDAGEMHAI